MSVTSKGAAAVRSPWPGFLARRAVTFVISLWLIFTVVFLLTLAMGGDGVRAAAGINATPEFVAQRRAELGLDDPLLAQYGRFLWGVLRLDFGSTVSTGQPVLEVIGQRFPYTLRLGLTAFAVSVVAGSSLGVALAVRTHRARGSRTEAAFNAVTGFFASVPDFLVAVGLVLVFAVWLRLLPAAGGQGPGAMVLPVVTVSIGLVAVFSRLVKTETARVLSEDYIRTARANRVPQSRILLRHVLPNVLTSTLTYAGLTLAGLMGGMIITETVFNWPGVGSLLIKSILTYDHTLMIGIVVLVAAITLLINLVVDVLLALVDPTSMIVRS